MDHPEIAKMGHRACFDPQTDAPALLRSMLQIIDDQHRRGPVVQK